MRRELEAAVIGAAHAIIPTVEPYSESISPQGVNEEAPAGAGASNVPLLVSGDQAARWGPWTINARIEMSAVSPSPRETFHSECPRSPSRVRST